MFTKLVIHYFRTFVTIYISVLPHMRCLVSFRCLCSPCNVYTVFAHHILCHRRNFTQFSFIIFHRPTWEFNSASWMLPVFNPLMSHKPLNSRLTFAVKLGSFCRCEHSAESRCASFTVGYWSHEYWQPALRLFLHVLPARENIAPFIINEFRSPIMWKYFYLFCCIFMVTTATVENDTDVPITPLIKLIFFIILILHVSIHKSYCSSYKTYFIL